MYRLELFSIAYTRAQRQYVTRKLVAHGEKLKRMQLSWFNHHREFHIKLHEFSVEKTRDLQRHWFVHKRGTSKKWTRRLSIELFGPKHKPIHEIEISPP